MPRWGDKHENYKTVKDDFRLKMLFREVLGGGSNTIIAEQLRTWRKECALKEIRRLPANMSKKPISAKEIHCLPAKWQTAAASGPSGQLTTSPRNIFVTQVRQTDGSIKSVMSSQALSGQSVRINHTWKGNKWEKPSKDGSDASGNWSNSGALFLLMTLYSHNNIFYRNTNHIVWKEILGFILDGISSRKQLESFGNYAVAIRRPSSIFQQIEMDPRIVVNAAMSGQEDIVLNILRADPSYLLKPATVKNSVGKKSIRTPLQAAIMANDVQLITLMRDHFVRLTTDLEGNPIDGLAEMQCQMIEIYKESLQAYFKNRVIAQLTASGAALDDDALTSIQTRFDAYWQSIQQRGIHEIIEGHDRIQAQNTFDFQPYIDAICNVDLNDPLQKQQLDDVIALVNASTPKEIAAVIAKTGASPTQTDAARAKPFDQLTLVEKLNRFREEFVKHIQQEIIFNPNHILEGLRQSERTWDKVNTGRVADPNDDKRCMIFSQLVGWAQRLAAEPVKQDIRQGTWYLTGQNEPRTRQSRFNNGGRNDYTDVSLVDPTVISGIGYKFASHESWAGPNHVFYITRAAVPFQNLCRAKTESFQNLLRSLGDYTPASLSV